MSQTSSARVAPPPEPATGSISWARLPLALLLGWWTVRLGFGISRWCFVDYVNLPFHEAGHIFLRPFGSTLHYLGGTIFQLLVPGLLIGYFLVRVINRFAAAVCTWWLGQSLVNVSFYMADARNLQLPLVGGGDHDWNHLFYTFGVLGEGQVAAISMTTRLLGTAVMLLGLAWCVVFVLPPHLREALQRAMGQRAGWAGRLLE
jgi:hypothetical protein